MLGDNGHAASRESWSSYLSPGQELRNPAESFTRKPYESAQECVVAQRSLDVLRLDERAEPMRCVKALREPYPIFKDRPERRDGVVTARPMKRAAI